MRVSKFLRLPEGFFAIKGVFALRNVAVMSMLIALNAILGRFNVYITPQYRAFTFTPLVCAINAALFGPWAALAYGFAGDLVQYLAQPQGPYFPGYALSEMLAGFFYAFFLYKRKCTLPRIAVPRAVALVVCDVALNYCWLSILYGNTAADFFMLPRFASLAMQYALQVAALFLLLKQLDRVRKYIAR